jgi:YHS domain-containing protein
MSLSRRKFLASSAAFLTVITASGSALARKVFTARGVAIRGYDTVAYFKAGKPVKGKPSLKTNWNGSTWQFSSQSNLDAFKANPAKYAPAYGGYCAWAMAQGYTASTIPQAWDIKGGKLYLNYDLSIRKKWRRDIPGNIRKGNANWPKVRAGL